MDDLIEDYQAGLRNRYAASSEWPHRRGWRCAGATPAIIPLIPAQVDDLAARIATEHRPAPDHHVTGFRGAPVPEALNWRMIIGVPSLVG